MDTIRQFEPGTPEFEQAVIDVMQNSSMYTGAGRIAAGQFIIVDGQVVDRPVGTKFNKKGVDYASG